MPHIIRQLPSDGTAVYVWFEAMHTRVDILLKSAVQDADALLAVSGEMRGLIERIETAGNCFDPDSELSRFNGLMPGERMLAGDCLYEMLSLCRRYHALTQGFFDVSAGSPGHTPHMLDTMHIEPDGEIWRESDALRLNLSGFIKGFALDRIRVLLGKKGISDAVVNMGNSSIMAIGDVPVKLNDGCLTTSGNPPGRPCQIVNPITGGLVMSPGRVEVASRSGAEGEVLSTVLFAAGADPEYEELLRSRFTIYRITRYF